MKLNWIQEKFEKFELNIRHDKQKMDYPNQIYPKNMGNLDPLASFQGPKCPSKQQTIRLFLHAYNVLMLTIRSFAIYYLQREEKAFQ